MRRGYRRVHAGLAGFAADLRAPEALLLPFPRDLLLAALRRYFNATGMDANWDAIATLDDTALVTALSMACPFGTEEKQALLEARDGVARAEALRALLEIDSFDSGHGDDSPPKAS